MKAQVGILAARYARALHDFRASHEARAQGKPGADCTRGPRATKSTGVGPQVNRGNAGFPCAVVYGLLRAIPNEGASVSHHCRLALNASACPASLKKTNAKAIAVASILITIGAD